MPAHSPPTPALTTISRVITVAAGIFAPGHLGALTTVVPFELVDAVLEETRSVQRRLRALPSRVGVYFLLAMCLFPEVGYRRVWDKMTAGLAGLPLVSPTTKALRDLRRRIGIAPIRGLFEVLSVPLAQPTTPGVAFGPYRLVSFDGCSSQKAPDTDRNRSWLGGPAHSGYPVLELMTLVETGTRAVIGAVFGPTAQGETSYARRLLHLVGPDMLVLWDKGFDGNDFLAAVTGTGAQVLGRLRTNRRTPVLSPLADGSYLSVIGAVRVRIIDANVMVTCADGTTFTASYRLATTLADARRYPASTLVGLYHQRWEHESAYYALKHTIMGGRVLRSGDPAGLQQEMWALLTLYQALRTVMVEAAQSRPGTDPDRCSVTVALEAARDHVVQAAGVVGTGEVGGLLGQRVLAALLPARRARVSTRKVKSPVSRYKERHDDGRPDTSRTVTGLDITVLASAGGEPSLPTASRDDRLSARPDHRREHVLALLRADAGRHWGAREIAQHLGDITLGSMYRQLSRWAAAGLLRKSGRGTYTALDEPPDPLSGAQEH